MPTKSHKVIDFIGDSCFPDPVEIENVIFKSGRDVIGIG